jgi:hypothetical protein
MNSNHSSQSPSDVESRSRRATSADSWIAPLALTRNLLLALLLLTPLFTLAPRIAAQTVPPLVNYQGRLSNPDGSPLPTADYTLTFNIYDAPTNGTLIWGPQVFDGAATQGHGPRIPVVQGYFNVMLGPSDTVTRSLSDAFTGIARYVEVTVSNRPPILPRQQILTTPFAFQAANSAKLAGYDWSVVFGTASAVTSGIPFSMLAQRQVGTNAPLGSMAASQTINTNLPGGTTNTYSVSLSVGTGPVFIALVGPPSPETGVPSLGSITSVELFRDGVRLMNYVGGVPEAAWSIDASAAPGEHSYSVKLGRAGGGSAQISNIRLVAFEL